MKWQWPRTLGEVSSGRKSSSWQLTLGNMLRKRMLFLFSMKISQSNRQLIIQLVILKNRHLLSMMSSCSFETPMGREYPNCRCQCERPLNVFECRYDGSFKRSECVQDSIKSRGQKYSSNCPRFVYLILGVVICFYVVHQTFCWIHGCPWYSKGPILKQFTLLKSSLSLKSCSLSDSTSGSLRSLCSSKRLFKLPKFDSLSFYCFNSMHKFGHKVSVLLIRFANLLIFISILHLIVHNYP